MDSLIFLNGTFVSKNDATISPFDHGFLYGDAVYETLLVHDTKLCFFDDHWNRLKNSLHKLDIPLPKHCSTAEKFLLITQNLIQKNKTSRGRLRITISRGENNFDFSGSLQPTILMHISPLPEYPQEIYSTGVNIITIEENRIAPEIKSTNFMASILGRKKIEKMNEQSSTQKIFEAVFITSQKFFREGTVSNIIGLQKKQKKICIPPRNTVLPGTVQALLEKIFLEKGYTVEEKNFSSEKIFSDFDELYISNSLFGVLPVREINGKIFRKNFPIFESFFGSDFFEKYLS